MGWHSAIEPNKAALSGRGVVKTPMPSNAERNSDDSATARPTRGALASCLALSSRLAPPQRAKNHGTHYRPVPELRRYGAERDAGWCSHKLPCSRV